MTLKNAQFYVEKCQYFDEPDIEKLPVTSDEFESLDVLFNSVTHLDTTQDQLVKIYMAVFMYQCLIFTEYFENINIKGTLFVERKKNVI